MPPNLHRYDYVDVDAKSVRVRRDEVYLWAPLNTSTGEVDMDAIRIFDDELSTLCDGWEWRRFNLTLTEPTPP